MSSTRNSQNLLTNVFRPTYVYTDGSGFTAGVVATNLKTLDVPTVRTNILDIGDDGSNVYLGTNAGVLYSTNPTNFNVSAFGVNAAAGISNVNNSVFIGTAAGLGMTNATDTTVIGANDAVIGTRNVVIGNRDFIFGSNNIVIGSDVSISESFKLNIANLIIGDIGSDVCGAALIFNSDVKINGTFTSTLFDASGISVNDLAVPGYIRNDPNFGIVMDISGGNFAFSGSGPSRVAGVVFSNYRIDASQGIYGEGYDLSTGLFLSGDISANGAIQIPSSSSNQIGGTTLSNGYVRAGAGASNAPSYSFSTDTSSGVYSASASNLGIVTAGIERMRITDIGRVGIGTTNPSVALDVSGSATILATFRQGSNTTTGVGISISNEIGQGALGLAYSNGAWAGNSVSGDLVLRNEISGKRIHFNCGNSLTNSAMTVFGSNVGIGTTSPSSILDISTASDPAVVLRSSTSNCVIRMISGAGADPATGFRIYSATSDQGFYTSNTNPLLIYMNAVERMRITSAGNVGIGTSNPLSLLQVGSTADGVYVNNPLASNTVSILGAARTSPSTSGISDLGGTLWVNSTSAFANNRGASVALGGRGFNFGGGELHMTYARMNGVQDLVNGAYHGNFVVETVSNGTLFERMRITDIGRVGIGTVAPTTLLDISGQGTGFVTAQIRNNSGQAGLQITGGGFTDNSGLQLFHNSTEQSIYNNNTNPFHIWTSNVRRMTILSNGNVGIGTTAPVTRLDISSTSDSAGGVRITNFSTISNTRVIDALMPNIPNTTGRVQILMGKNFSNPNNYATFAYCHLGGDTSASNYMGFGKPTGDGLVVNQSGNVGIGTTAPAYLLDVSAAAGTAAVNMNTWPRVPIGNVLILRNIAASSGYVGNTANFASNIQAIDSNLATVVSSNTTNGASFIIQKSGIWSISWQFNSSTTGVIAFIDVSTNNNSNVAWNTAGNPVIAFEQAPAGSGVLTWTGYLPSNNTYIYKMRMSATPNNISNAIHFTMTFLAETPTSASSFPF